MCNVRLRKEGGAARLSFIDMEDYTERPARTSRDSRSAEFRTAQQVGPYLDILRFRVNPMKHDASTPSDLP